MLHCRPMLFPPGAVVLISDASFCPDTRAAGWAGAAIARDGINVHRTNGPIKDRCSKSGTAEFFASLYTLRWAIDKGVVWKNDKVIIIVDSLEVYGNQMRKSAAAVERLTAEDKLWSNHVNGQGPLMMMSALIGRYGLDVEFRQTAGHPTKAVRNSDRVARLMHDCDRLSRTQMKERRRWTGCGNAWGPFCDMEDRRKTLEENAAKRAHLARLKAEAEKTIWQHAADAVRRWLKTA